MSRGHKGVRELVEATAKSLGNSIRFTYGRTSDFNVMRDKKYPFITCDPLVGQPAYATNGTINYQKAWTAQMAFYQLDKEASTQEQYQLILDEMDELVDKFVNKLNFYTYNSDTIVITFGQQQPFIKATADILTGYILPVTITPQDDFDYCADDLNCEIESEC